MSFPILNLVVAFFLIVPLACGGSTQYKVPLNLKEKAKAEKAVRAELPDIKANMGDGPGESNAILGEPLPYVWTRLDHLRDEAPGSDPTQLVVKGSKKLVYPLLYDNQKIAFTVESQSKKTNTIEKWEVVSWGKSPQQGRIFDLRSKHSTATKTPIDSYFVYSVPALNFDFLGLVGMDGKSVLIPTVTDKKMGFESGKELPATEVLRRLRDAAKKLDQRAPG